MRYHAAAACEYRSRQASSIAVTKEHDERQVIGEVLFLEQCHDEPLWAVCEVDDNALDPELRFWYSAQVRGPMQDNVIRDIELTAIGVTRRPAGLAQSPIELVAGGLTPWTWSNATPRRKLLERAAQYQRTHRRFGAHEIARPAARLGAGMWLDENEELHVEDRRVLVDYDRRPPGPIEHGPPGRILRVR
jgi:hypothetical protein